MTFVDLKSKDGLTPKQEKFCELVVDYSNLKKAFLEVYGEGNRNENTLRCNISRQMNIPAVKERIQQIRMQLAEEANWRRLDSVRVLATIAEDKSEGSKASDRVGAVKELNTMFGWREVDYGQKNREPIEIRITRAEKKDG